MDKPEVAEAPERIWATPDDGYCTATDLPGHQRDALGFVAYCRADLLTAAEAERDEALAERDRQYDQNCEQITQIAARDAAIDMLHADVGALRSALEDAVDIVHRAYVSATMDVVNSGPAHPTADQVDKYRVKCLRAEKAARDALADTANRARAHDKGAAIRAMTKCAEIADEIGGRDIFEDRRGFCRATSKDIAANIRAEISRLRDAKEGE